MSQKAAPRRLTRAHFILFLVILLLAAAAVSLFALRYSYDHLDGKPVRTNRFTGSAQVLERTGWERLVVAQTVSAADLAKVEVTADFVPYGDTLTLNIYNGTTWNIKELEFQVQVLPASGPAPDREIADLLKYAPPCAGRAPQTAATAPVSRILRVQVDAPPFTTAKAKSTHGISSDDCERFRWTLLSAKGFKRSQTRVQD